MGSITVKKKINLEESTGIPAERIHFEFDGGAEEILSWLQNDKHENVHVRQLVNIVVDSETKTGYFVEMNAWDDWEEGFIFDLSRFERIGV